LAYAQDLRTPTVHRAIAHATRLGEIVRYGFPESVWRQYARVPDFPRGLLPFGDSVCRFNPVYGQGMSVAALEACRLREVLGTLGRAGGAPLDDLAPAFFAETEALIEAPWAMAAVPDFVHPMTRGRRPADFEITLKFGVALGRLAARDPAVHKLVAEVQTLLKPRSVYRDPALVERVLAVMAET
jgi:2-polyprenyl-6-methoxyphenol hydroxylase-like FAD-dependent oxidoreductase